MAGKMWYHQEGDKIRLLLYIQPGAKVTEVCGIYDGALKIRLNAPPIDGRANEAIKKFLAQQFSVSLKNIHLLRGEKSRKKVFVISNSTISPENLINKTP